MKRGGPKSPTAVHGLLGLMYHPLEKANAIVDCLENQFTPHDLCMSQHDTSMYEAYGPHDLNFQQQYVYGCSILGYEESL
jgi:hypothetical protein